MKNCKYNGYALQANQKATRGEKLESKHISREPWDEARTKQMGVVDGSSNAKLSFPWTILPVRHEIASGTRKKQRGKQAGVN